MGLFTYTKMVITPSWSACLWLQKICILLISLNDISLGDYIIFESSSGSTNTNLFATDSTSSDVNEKPKDLNQELALSKKGDIWPWNNLCTRSKLLR